MKEARRFNIKRRFFCFENRLNNSLYISFLALTPTLLP